MIRHAGRGLLARIGCCAALGLGACIPAQRYDSPEVQGVVTDATSHSPIAGARVIVRNRPAIAATTDAQGTFMLHPEERTVWVAPLPTDQLPPPGSLMVEAPGYLPKEIALHRGLNFLTIELDSAQER